MDLKERIQAKSEELFKRYGIRSITMDEIASQLGISKKTIYHFYADKDDLVLDVVNGMLCYNKAGCLECIAASENAIHEKILASRRAQEMFANLNPVLISDLRRYYPQAFKQFEEYKSKQVDIETIAMMHLRFVSNYMQMEEVMKGTVSLSYLEEQMTDFFLHGMSTEKGLRIIEKYKPSREQHKYQTV